MRHLTSTSRPRQNDRVVHRQLQSGAVLLNLDDGAYFEINAVGLAIWNALDGRQLEDVVEAVRSDFDDVPEDLEDEVYAFVDALMQSGLIEVS